jgi:uncharacterized membrane protein
MENLCIMRRCLDLLNKRILFKLLCYKAGAIGLTILVAYAFSGSWAIAGGLGVACELATCIYYYIFESIWRTK